MKVLHIVPSMSRSEAGVWFAARGLVEALADRGQVKVCLAGPRRLDSDSLIEELTRRRIDARAIRSVGPGFMELPTQAGQELGDQQPDVVHVHGLWRPVGAYVTRMSRFKRLPRVVSPHGMLEAWALGRSAWKKRLAATLYERHTLQGSQVLHALCEAEVASIRAYGLRGPVCVIPNGVQLPDTPICQPGCASAEATLTLLFLGRIDRKKGLHLLLPAFARALSTCAAARKWQLKIAGFGDADYEAALREQAATLGLSDRVRFLGAVFGSNKHQLLVSADAFVLPSYSEGLPMAILEAAAYGLPTVCTAECNLPELYAAGAGCTMSLNVDDMANDLASFLSLSEDSRQDMGSAARRLVQSSFQWASVASKFEAVYAWAANGGPRPSYVLLD